MISRIALSLLLGAGCAFSQEIANRPEKLTYKPLTFQAPKVKDFKTKLKNGIPVFIAQDPNGQPFVRINLMVRGGSYLDPKGKEGLAVLLGNEMRTGGTDKTPAEKLDERIEFLAAQIRSSFGSTSGNIFLEILEKDFSAGLELYMEVLTQPAFAQDRLDLAKKQTRLGLDQRNDSANSIAGYQMGYLLNGENHFSNAAVTEASIKAITREDLKAFHARVLHPSNMVIAVSGKFDKKVVLDALNKTLGELKPVKGAEISPKPPAPEFTRKAGIFVCEKDVPQSTVQFAVPGLRRTDPDWYATVVMNDILGGGGFTARLMKKIRSDEGLTYGIGSGFGTGAYWPGDWTCGLQTKNRSVAYAMRLALAEINRMKAEPISDQELQVVKDSIMDGFPARFPSKQAIVNLFASEQLTGWPEDFYANYREKIQAITKDDVQRVAKKYLDIEKMVLLVVGKIAEAEEGDVKDHPGKLSEVAKLPVIKLPLRDPLTMKPIK
ncbi:MAG: pitrilysin family protein [Holophaga sp.]|nr:pitrilysin family protein [Holophaga sp.]